MAELETMCLMCDVELIRTDYRDERSHTERHQDAYDDPDRPRFRLKSKGMHDNDRHPMITVDGAVAILPDHYVDTAHGALLAAISAIEPTSALPLANIMRYLFTDRRIHELLLIRKDDFAKVKKRLLLGHFFPLEIDQAFAQQTSVSERLVQAMAEAKLIYTKLLRKYGMMDIDLIYESDEPLPQTKVYYEQMAMLKDIGGKVYHMKRFDPDKKQMIISVLVPREKFGRKWTLRERTEARMSISVNTPRAATSNRTVHDRTFLSASPEGRMGYSFPAAQDRVDNLLRSFRSRGRAGTLERTVNTAKGEWYPKKTVIQRLTGLQPKWPDRSNPASAPPSPDTSPEKTANVAVEAQLPEESSSDEEPSVEQILQREVEQAGDFVFAPPSELMQQDRWWKKDERRRRGTLDDWDKEHMKHEDDGSRHNITTTGTKPELAVAGIDYNVVPGLGKVGVLDAIAALEPSRRASAELIAREARQEPAPQARNQPDRTVEEQYTRVTEAFARARQYVLHLRNRLIRNPGDNRAAEALVQAEHNEEALRQKHAQVERALRSKANEQRAAINRERQSELLRERKKEIEAMATRGRQSLASTFDSDCSSFISDNTVASPSPQQSEWVAGPETQPGSRNENKPPSQESPQQPEWVTEAESQDESENRSPSLTATQSLPIRLTAANLEQHAISWGEDTRQARLTASARLAAVAQKDDSTPFPAYTDPFMQVEDSQELLPSTVYSPRSGQQSPKVQSPTAQSPTAQSPTAQPPTTRSLSPTAQSPPRPITAIRIPPVDENEAPPPPPPAAVPVASTQQSRGPTAETIEALNLSRSWSAALGASLARVRERGVAVGVVSASDQEEEEERQVEGRKREAGKKDSVAVDRGDGEDRTAK